MNTWHKDLTALYLSQPFKDNTSGLPCVPIPISFISRLVWWCLSFFSQPQYLSKRLASQSSQITSFFWYAPYPETERNRMTEKLKKREMWVQLPYQTGLKEGILVYLFQSLCLGSICARSLLNCQLHARHPRDFWRKYYSTFLESKRGIISNADVNTSSFKTTFCSFPSSSLTFSYFHPIIA